MSSRWVLSLQCLLLTCVGMICLRADAPARSQSRSPESPLSTGAYEIEVCDEHAAFPISLTDGGRYALIVSSLGDAAATYRVRLDADESVSASHSAIRRIRPLHVTRIPTSVGQISIPSVIVKETTQTNGLEIGSTNVTRDFFLQVADLPPEDARGYTRVTGQLIGNGRKVRVFLDSQQSVDQLSAGLADEIVRLMDDDIIPGSAARLGMHRDIDGDGKLTVLLTPWLSKLQGGRTTVNGFVRSSDFRSGLEAPFSNQADVLYLNSNLQSGGELRTLLAHEYTHAVCFSRRLPSENVPAGLPEEEDWLNEAIAHVAENLHATGWSNLDYRIHNFLAEPQRSPLVVRDYFRAGLWRDHGCRGATYLFLRWCVDQYGEGLLPSLLANPVTGPRNLEWTTGVLFSELYRNWTIALLDGGKSPLPHRIESLPLNGRVGQFDLQGPHLRRWNPCTSACEVELRGTATAFIAIDGVTGKTRQITAHAALGTQLQLTLMKLPAAELESSSLQTPTITANP